MNDSQFLTLCGILNYIGFEYNFIEPDCARYRDFRIQTPTEEGFNLVDALMPYVGVVEWYPNENGTYIEIPFTELPSWRNNNVQEENKHRTRN